MKNLIIAKHIGSEAFKSGLDRKPGQDQNFVEFIEEIMSESEKAKLYMKAWLKGWDDAKDQKHLLKSLKGLLGQAEKMRERLELEGFEVPNGHFNEALLAIMRNLEK